MPQFLYLLVDHPILIAVPIVLFAALALWSGSRTAWVATGAWVVYFLYELGMHGGVLCGSEEACMKRWPLYFGYPLLAFLSLVALVQGYVHIRARRLRERRNAIRQP